MPYTFGLLQFSPVGIFLVTYDDNDDNDGDDGDDGDDDLALGPSTSLNWFSSAKACNSPHDRDILNIVTIEISNILIMIMIFQTSLSWYFNSYHNFHNI